MGPGQIWLGNYPEEGTDSPVGNEGLHWLGLQNLGIQLQRGGRTGRTPTSWLEVSGASCVLASCVLTSCVLALLFLGTSCVLASCILRLVSAICN